MRRYKVREVIELLEEDGWFLYNTRGDHRQFKHLQKQERLQSEVQ